MDEIQIDTTAINEINNDINKVITEIEEIITEIFSAIEKMSKDNNEWKGTSANRFVTLAMADKENYILLKNNLYDFSNYLTKYCSEMDSAMQIARG